MTVEPRPKALPTASLFNGYTVVSKIVKFRVRTGNGEFQVLTLYADGNKRTQTIASNSGVLNLTLAEGESSRVSALLIRRLHVAEKRAAEEDFPPRPDPVRISHEVPEHAIAGQPVNLWVRTQSGDQDVVGIRLHYRALNSLEEVRTVEISGKDAKFSIPKQDVTGSYGLLYYFEILTRNGRGRFIPDPEVERPYYVLDVR
jgi:hypothetical protein